MTKPIEVVGLSDKGDLLFCDWDDSNGWHTVVLEPCRVVKMIAVYPNGVTVTIPLHGDGVVVAPGMTLILDLGAELIIG